ncbi:MAG: tail fiber domain-containing protein [Saprospiraceae bacterium]|nr:tail fiber domain-containing protein [Saprospiraceae bacterium]
MKTLYLLFVVTMFNNLLGQTAIIGESINNNAVSGISTGGYGVYGFSAESNRVRGQSTGASGVSGQSDNSVGVSGNSTSSYGVYGQSFSSQGVNGTSTSSYGVVGFSFQGPGARFTGQGGIAINLGGADSQWGDGSDDCVISTDAGSTGDMILVAHDNFVIHLDDDNNSTSALTVFNGANNTILTLNEAGNLSTAGTINGSSDINRKENITPVMTGDILEKVANMPISEWQFKGEEIRHIGPMAQDFYTAFGLGQGETTIATVDADGVALAAIQALKKENDLLKEQLVELQNRFKEIETIVNEKNKSEK